MMQGHIFRLAPIVVAAFLMGSSCPDYPDNEDHWGAENPDCRACHVHDEIGPRPPGNHFEGGDLDWSNCKHCHNEG